MSRNDIIIILISIWVILRIPPTLRLDVAALAEPLAVSVHACNRAKVTFGQKILVCGAGTMGLLTFLTAKAYGASRIAILGIF